MSTHLFMIHPIHLSFPRTKWSTRPEKQFETTIKCGDIRMKKSITHSPKLINSNDSKSRGKHIKIAKKEPLGSSITMDHHKRRSIRFTVKCDAVNKPRLVTSRAEPSHFGARRTSTYVNVLLNITGSAIPKQSITIVLIAKRT